MLQPQPSSWDGGLKVTLPADSRGIGAFALSACPADGACSNETQAQRWTVNAPRVHWALGDDSSAAAPKPAAVPAARGRPPPASVRTQAPQRNGACDADAPAGGERVAVAVRVCGARGDSDCDA
jgi:hypothetical protein